MNSKAIRKQLLAAVAMVLVAAVALGSSTYAWFVASGTVTAEGMKVQAQSEGNLVIRYLEGNWGTTATAKMSKYQALKPTSTYDLSTWVYSAAAQANVFTSDGKYTTVTTNVNPGTDDSNSPNEYALVKKFQIRSATADLNARAKGLYVEEIKVTVGDTTNAPSQNLSSSLRVGITCVAGDDTTNAIYGPVGSGVNAPTDNYTVKVPGSGDTYSDKTVTLKQVGWKSDNTAPNFENVDSSTVIPNKDGDPVDVYIYVWFEGEDTHLYSDNFSPESMSVAVKFQSCSTKSAAVEAAKIDLSGTTTVSQTATTAKASAGAEDTTNYYAIEGKMADGKQLYTDETSKGGLTSTSAIYIINGDGDNKVAEIYKNVKLPS